jgi:hypothetical protein
MDKKSKTKQEKGSVDLDNQIEMNCFILRRSLDKIHERVLNDAFFICHLGMLQK